VDQTPGRFRRQRGEDRVDGVVVFGLALRTVWKLQMARSVSTRGEGRTSAIGQLKSILSPITRKRPDGSAHIRTSRCCDVFPS